MQDNKTLLNKINKYIKSDSNTIEERMSLFYNIRDSNFYNQYFTRTRKRDVFENRITRNAVPLPYMFLDHEYHIYQEITKHLKKKSTTASMAQIFRLMARQRQMTSCLPAALQHWKDNDVMTDMLYEDMGLEEDDEMPPEILEDNLPIKINDELIGRFAKSDSKFSALLSIVSTILNENKEDKIIIFSFYRYTIDYLYRRLSDNGYNCEKMMGGMGDDKDNIIEHFRTDPNCNILISSEVGSEGIDLQFASIEINYDLPWNPMRLEQRIGRIDRIGQEKDKIRIYNFTCKNTIEDRVLQRLYERIDIFKYSIGDIEEILGEEIQQISIELFTSDLTESEKEKKAEQTIEAIALKKLDMEKLEEQAGLSAEFSDVIIDNIKNANDNKRYIMASELIQYTEDFFANYYNGTKIEYNDDNSRLIALSNEAQMDFRDYIRNNHLQVSNLGHKQDSVLCIFNNNHDDYKKYRIFELIDINHAFIKWMKFINTGKTYTQYGCSAVKISKNKVKGINAGIYTYYIQKWNTEGYKNTNELKYFVIDTETKYIIDDNLSENFIITTLTQGCDCSEIKYGLENFDIVLYSLEKCRNYANEAFSNFEAVFNNENIMICERNSEYLKRTHERKKSSIQEQIDKSRQNGQSEKIIRMHEGKLRKTEEIYSIQLKKIESKIRGRCTFSDIAVGLIKVCFSDSINSHNFVLFNGTEYKASVIYYDYKNDFFYFNKPNANTDLETIKYFKYSMISDSLPRSKYLSIKINDIRLEILCSLFFIACLIKKIEIFVTKFYSKNPGVVDIDWNFTMGVPIDNYSSKNRNLYDKVLNIANRLSKVLTADSMSLSALIGFYKMNQDMKIMPFGQSNLNTLPELYAESLIFLQNRGVDTGVYAIVDIGGGTVDMAILYKESPTTFSITSKDIQPLGIEIVSSRILMDKNSNKLIKKYLKDKNLSIDKSIIDLKLESELQEQLRRSFAQIVVDLKSKKDNVLRSKNGKLPVIICGGGTKHKWYEDGIINKNKDLLRPLLAKGLKLDQLAIEKLFPSNFNINHRLLISYALSGRIGSEIVELQGYPWNFDNINPISLSSVSGHKRLQDIAKEKYGEPL